MNTWENRVPEIAYLLNPAFCAVILYNAVFEYQQKREREFPITLIYLVLPILLHKPTRDRVNSRSNMVKWIQTHQDVLIGFPKRVTSLIPFTNEALEFLLHQKILDIPEGTAGGLVLNKELPKSKMKGAVDEVKECYNKARHVGKWFAVMGAEENIYAAWGVRP